MTSKYTNTPGFVAAFVFLFGLLLHAPALAQLDPLSTDSASDAPAQAEDQADPALQSASSALLTFLRSFPSERLGRPDRIVPDGIKVLSFKTDFLNDERKKEIAVVLKKVIDKYEFIEEEVIDERVGDSDFFTLVSDGDVYVALEEDDSGNWHFTTQTVERAEAMYDLVREKEAVAGIEEVRDQPLGFAIKDLYPETLHNDLLILQSWQWISLFILIAIGVAADRLLVLVLVLVATAGLKKTKFEIDTDNRKAAVRPFGLLALAGILYFGINHLLLPIGVTNVLTVAVTFLASLSFVWAAYKGVDALAATLLSHAEKTESKIDDLIIPFVARVAKIFVVAFGLIFIADQLKVNITSLLAGLGLGGLAFALAAKDTVENIFGSLTVLIDQPFSVGDWVTIDGGVDGTVETVGLRSTRIRTFYNSLVTVPNATLIRSAVDNYGKRSYRRWKSTLSVTYDTPPEKIEAFCEGIRELIRLHPYTRKDYFHVYANDYGASSLDIMLYLFFAAPDWGTELRERHRMFLDILRLAEKLEIEFAFPTQTLHISKEMPAHENNPKNQESAFSAGKSLAHGIVHEAFGSQVTKPDPVKFEIPMGLSTEEVEKLQQEAKGGDG